MSSSPFDHPLYRELLGDPEVAQALSARTEVLVMLAFELALAEAQAEAGVIPAEAAAAIRAAVTLVSLPDDALAAGVARDGVAGPELVRLLREAAEEPYGQYVHLGATSQDLADSALMVRLAMVRTTLDGRIAALESACQHLLATHGSGALMGRTRMQAARPITVADRIRAWWGPLGRLRQDLPADVFAVQLGGPVGTLADFGDKGPGMRARLAHKLGLADAHCWHSQRDRVVRIAGWLAAIAGALGKLGQDIALMAQMGEVRLSGAGGSSAMPHKQNPVNAEVLVALARYGAVLQSALLQALVHEQERSGAAWTLEWLALPQLAMTAGASTRLALKLIGQIDGMGNDEA